MKVIMYLICLALGSTAVSATGDSMAVARDYWPTTGWRSSAPGNQGVSQQKLNDMQMYIESDLPVTTSVLVIRHGYIVHEQYYLGDRTELRTLYSITKSILSSLIGIAVDMKLINGLDMEMISYFSEYSSKELNPQARKITIRNLLTMASGLDQSSPLETSLMRKFKNEPGKVFEYNEMDPQTLSIILTKTTGLKAVDFANRYLFEPLGITEIQWSTTGKFSSGGDGLMMTSRDAAKIGYLYLNKGVWDKMQLIPTEWVSASTKKQIRPDESTETVLGDYGLFWWTRSCRGMSSFYALGYGGQLIYVVPDQDLVAVVTSLGGESDMPLYLGLVDDYITEAVLE